MSCDLIFGKARYEVPEPCRHLVWNLAYPPRCVHCGLAMGVDWAKQMWPNHPAWHSDKHFELRRLD